MAPGQVIQRVEEEDSGHVLEVNFPVIYVIHDLLHHSEVILNDFNCSILQAHITEEFQENPGSRSKGSV